MSGWLCGEGGGVVGRAWFEGATLQQSARFSICSYCRIDSRQLGSVLFVTIDRLLSAFSGEVVVAWTLGLLLSITHRLGLSLTLSSSPLQTAPARLAGR